MTEYRVSDVSSASPEMSNGQFAAFKADIQARGQLVPIVVIGDEVVDGRKRLSACRALGIEPKVICLTPDDDGEAVARSLNELRTHYTQTQLSMMAARRANLRSGVRTDRATSDVGVGIPTPTPVSLQEAAEDVGVHRSTVAEAKRILRDAAPEVAAACEDGTLTLHAAKMIVDHIPKTDQPAAVEKVVEASKSKYRHSPASVLGIGDAKEQSSGKDSRVRDLRAALKLIRGVKQQTKGSLLTTLRTVDHQIRNAIDALEGVS